MGNDTSPELRQAIADHAYNYGEVMAQKGYITYAIDWIGFGERNDSHKPNHLSVARNRDWCNLYYLHATMFGMTSLSINVAHGKAATDVVSAFPNVDADRLGVMGLERRRHDDAVDGPLRRAVQGRRDHLLQRPLVGLRHARHQLLRDAGRAGAFQAGRSARPTGPARAAPAADRHRRQRHLLQGRHRDAVLPTGGAHLRRSRCLRPPGLDLHPGEHGWGGNKSEGFFACHLS